MNKRLLAAAGVFVAAMAAGASTASGAPEMVLPDATLFCGSVTVAPTEWTTLPFRPTLWIKSGPLAGHYVIISEAHYGMPGLQYTPPETYAGLEMVAPPTSFGLKTGRLADSMQCDFISR